LIGKIFNFIAEEKNVSFLMAWKSVSNFLAFFNDKSDCTLTKSFVISTWVCKPTNSLLETTLNLK
jgi:hypothetical protein